MEKKAHEKTWLETKEIKQVFFLKKTIQLWARHFCLLTNLCACSNNPFQKVLKMWRRKFQEDVRCDYSVAKQGLHPFTASTFFFLFHPFFQMDVVKKEDDKVIIFCFLHSSCLSFLQSLCVCFTSLSNSRVCKFLHQIRPSSTWWSINEFRSIHRLTRLGERAAGCNNRSSD